MAEIQHCYLNFSKPNVSWLYLPSVSEYAKGQSLITLVLNVGSEHVELSGELWKLTCSPCRLFLSPCYMCILMRMQPLVTNMKTLWNMLSSQKTTLGWGADVTCNLPEFGALFLNSLKLSFVYSGTTNWLLFFMVIKRKLKVLCLRVSGEKTDWLGLTEDQVPISMCL